MALEYATFTSDGRVRGVFGGLAEATGFSEVECAAAAQAGLLAKVVKVAELRARRRGHPADGGLSGAVALARLQEMKAKLQDARLRDAGLI